MAKISAVIITLNEEKNLERCLRSLNFVDEIVVVDSHSTDKTEEIARKFTDKIFEVDWGGFGKTKELARQKASCSWVLSVDADEEATPELKEEILQTVQNNFYSGYFIPRKSNFLGKWINHSGWYPDYVLRLFQKETGKFDDSLVHEQVRVKGEIGYLKNPLRHYTYPNLELYIKKLKRYTTLSAQQLYQRKVRTYPWDLIFRPPATFIKMYLLKLGFLDGWQGLILAGLSGYQVLIKYLKLWKLSFQRKNV
ncbi:MAG: hypothetical protein A2145_01725 [candidate division Zixibacteria bacterium RBG_16_40_9]|nr:MAG: hypothetical protein A2145_01725 [candidate division Zixibacteria bacterium RBG_16_40_9]